MRARDFAKRALTPRGLVLARCLTRGFPVARWGNLRRVQPFSEQFGFDRDTPVDRHYLHDFLARHAADITGDVLEIQVPSYARRFGSNLRAVHTLDINPAFTPTYCVDLAGADASVPSNTYDCFLLPQTLSVLRELDAALEQALRVVRPGGVILATTASLGPLIPDGPDYWRMSAAGWRLVAQRVWKGCDVEVSSYGNCLAAIAAMHGLAAEELSASELDARDPRYPVLVTMRCRKPV